MGYYSSFVVRFWVDDSGKVIKGQLEHTSSGKAVHFTPADFAKMDEICRFAREHLSRPPEYGGGLSGGSGKAPRQPNNVLPR